METAAFYRVEGAVVGRPAIAAAAYLVAGSQHPRDKIVRLAGVAAALPFAALGSIGDRSVATRLAYAGLRGMSEDRLAVLGEEYGERYLVPAIRDVARSLVEASRARGHRVVLVSEQLDVVVAPVARALRVPAADVVANRAELDAGGLCTGRLRDPLVGGGSGATWARAFARERGVDLEASFAYGASGDDAVLLGLIGRPCAVMPDRALRRLARDNGWPVVESGGMG
jgi:phosphoserine phosphatase